MEKQPQPNKKPVLKNYLEYRKNLADDLKVMREEDDQLAHEVLEEERGTTRYKMAESNHGEYRKATQAEFIDRNKELEEVEIDFNDDLDKLTAEKKAEILAGFNDFIISNKIFKADTLLRGEFVNQEGLSDYWNVVNGRISRARRAVEHDIKYVINLDAVSLDYDSVDPEIFIPGQADSRFREIPSIRPGGNKIKYAEGNHIEYMYEKFKHSRYLPGIEYAKYLSENPDNVPDLFKTGRDFYFPSAVFIGSEVTSSFADGEKVHSSINNHDFILRGRWVDPRIPSPYGGKVYYDEKEGNYILKDDNGNHFYEDRSPVGEPKSPKFIISKISFGTIYSHGRDGGFGGTQNSSFITLVPKK